MFALSRGESILSSTAPGNNGTNEVISVLSLSPGVPLTAMVWGAMIRFCPRTEAKAEGEVLHAVPCFTSKIRKLPQPAKSPFSWSWKRR